MMNWNVITSDITAEIGNAYFCNGSETINITLPTTASLGDSFCVYAVNPLGWVIVQGTNQQIRCDQLTSTAGPTGGVSSSSPCDTVTLTFCTASGLWEATNFSGNINVY